MVVFSQTTRNDSIAYIKKLQTEASTAISGQNFDDAIVKLIEVEKIVQENNYDDLRASAVLGLAELNYYLQNYQKARSEIEIAFNYLEENKSDAELASAYTLYGLILTRLDEFDTAENILQKADKICISLNDESLQANVILAFGILEMQRANYNKAINYFPFLKDHDRIPDAIAIDEYFFFHFYFWSIPVHSKH